MIGQMVRQVVKEIGHVDLSFVSILGNGVAILVYQFKIGYFMIFPNVLNGRIYKFFRNHIGLVNGEAFIWNLQLINKEDNDG